jgi:uncharacterized LabA/DUF88 family protein
VGKQRVSCFVDGFNLYHAVDDLGKPHLKWLDLWKLTEVFVDPAIHELTTVYYFSAYATWRPDAMKRHKQYVSALGKMGVVPVMGHFKEKERRCLTCRRKWIAHEEKETDVNAAIWMLNEARKGSFDSAYIMSGDSDLAPAVRMLRNEFPQKEVKIIAMPGRMHSKELAQAGKKLAKIKEIHLERSLLPDEIRDAANRIIVGRPAEYTPPLKTS